MPPEPRAGFRVLPYLQAPGSTQMTINWFTELGTDATFILNGPGLPPSGQTLTVAGVRNPVNAYQESELKQGTFDNKRGGVTPQGEWIRADEPFKYQAVLEHLQPGATYTYEVQVDGYSHTASFTTTNPYCNTFSEPLHVIAYSDSETDPKGRTTNREWEATNTLAPGSEPRPGAGSAWDQKFGGGNRNGAYALNYALTEDQGQFYNNQVVAEANPDLLLMPGDLVERGSSQTHWDEFFRYYSGDKGNLLDDTPVLTSLGNHEVYGYGTADDRSLIVRSRMEYNQYFDTFGSDNPAAQDAYYRVDQGGITFISLDVTNGQPDTTLSTVPDSERSTGDDSKLTPDQWGTDTQGVFTQDEYNRDYHVAVENGWTESTEPDQPDFMPGSEQYKWLEAQLQDARARGQIIIVQWHHVAYSSGVHGTTMGNNNPDEQPGTPTRHLEPLLEQYSVAAVISGHDEMFEVSYADENNDGVGIYHWDVGVASDGLRADMKQKNADGSFSTVDFNTHSIWSAQYDQPELWQTNANGVTHLVSGGKHYGHLDMQFAPYSGPALPGGAMPTSQLTMTPVMVFPVLNDNYDVERVERIEMTEGTQRVYFDANGNVLNPDAPAPAITPIAPVAEAETNVLPGRCQLRVAEATQTPTPEPTAAPSTAPITAPVPSAATDQPADATATAIPTAQADALARTGADDLWRIVTATGVVLTAAVALLVRRRRA